MSAAAPRPPLTAVAHVHDALARDGHAVIDAASLASLCGVRLSDLAAWRARWDDLPSDRYLRDGGHYRQRRHSCFVVRGDAGRFVFPAQTLVAGNLSGAHFPDDRCRSFGVGLRSFLKHTAHGVRHGFGGGAFGSQPRHRQADAIGDVQHGADELLEPVSAIPRLSERMKPKSRRLEMRIRRLLSRLTMPPQRSAA